MNILLFVIIMGIVPFFVGVLFQGKKKSGAEYSYAASYVTGMVAILAIFQLLAVPFTFLRLSLSALVYSFGGIIILLCLLSVIFNFAKFLGMMAAAGRSIISSPWQIWAAVILICVQVFVLARYVHIDDDDAFYVATSAAAVETDTIYQIDPYTGEEYKTLPARYVLASFPIFTSAVAKITSIHPTVVAHVGFAVVFILFAYMVYAMIGQTLFKTNKRASGYFLIFVSLLHIFSAYSVYTPGVFLLTRVWQGKAVLASALLPAVMFFVLRAAPKKSPMQNWLILFMAMTACCMATSMGVLLSAVVAGLTALISAAVYRNWRVIPYILLCCVPNLVYAGVYLLIK